MTRLFFAIAACCLSLVQAGVASPLAEGWTVQRQASSISFTTEFSDAQRVTGFFTAVTGDIAPNGVAQFDIALDSVKTGDALQDTRLRFLVFETFKAPTARVSAQLDPSALLGLEGAGQKTLNLPIRVTLNGATHSFDAQFDVVQIGADIVSVASVAPIELSASQFGLLPGLARLERAANVVITPKTSVSFEMLFKATAPVVERPDLAVLQACVKQVDTIANSDQVYFTSGSTELETKSYPLLDAIVDTMAQCPTLELLIEGHTDNVGAADYNTRLSIGRAAEVVSYLAVKGVDATRLGATGFGEDRPIADNATKRGRWKNRRIEFVVPNVDQ